MHKFAKPKYIPPHLTSGSEEQGEVEKVFKSVGGLVYRISVPRRKGNAGVSDDLVFLPQRRVLLAWDSKAGSEFAPPADPRRLEPEQKVFGELMARGYRTMFGWGDRDTARQWLAEQIAWDPSDIPRSDLIVKAHRLMERAYDLEQCCIGGTISEVRDRVKDCRKATEAVHDAAWPPLPQNQASHIVEDA